MPRKVRRKGHTKSDGTFIKAHLVTVPDTLSFAGRWNAPPPASASDAAVADAIQSAETSTAVLEDVQENSYNLEDLQKDLDQVAAIPETVFASLSRSDFREAIRAGHKETGCKCGTEINDLSGNMSPKKLAALHNCIVDNFGPYSILQVRLEMWEEQIALLRSLQDRLQDYDVSELENVDDQQERDLISVFLICAEQMNWDSPSGKHSFYGKPLSLARVQSVIEAVDASV